MVLIIALVTLFSLFSLYDINNPNRDRKIASSFIAVVILVYWIIAFVVKIHFNFNFKYDVNNFIFNKHWFLSGLSFGSILFLIFALYNLFKRKRMLSKETEEQRSEREEREHKLACEKTELARERNERARELIQNNKVIEAQIKERKETQQLKCPKCGSSNLTANNKGFGLGKAAVGGVLLGPVGLLGGLVGSKKAVFICLYCGNQFEK
ncbi:MAG TPA: hypothetical protein VFC41_07495 [Anaerovoracaceae bacterium]|nr:hypothetical protein [Anaerovoracaceae bacterium]